MNEQNEKYGIQLTAETSAFKKAIKEASKYVKAFSEGAKDSFDKQINKSFSDFKNIKDKMFGKKEETPEKKSGYEKQIEYVKSQLKDIEKQKSEAFKTTVVNEEDEEKLKHLQQTLKYIDKELQKQHKINVEMGMPDDKSSITKELNRQKEEYSKAISKIPTKTEPDTKLIEELDAKYEILENKLDRLNQKQEDYNDNLEEMGEEGTKSTSLLGSLFDKSIAKIKRFTFYLLGARSVFSMFMKYQSIYYQYNEKMQYQSELSQNAIALSLAPAFEFLGNMVAYASIGFAKFIELLTGVNILSKVSTKGIRDYNKSLKETQTLLSGVDEITNLTLPSGTGLASQYKALDEFRKKVAEVEKWFKENPVARWITDTLIPALKEVYKFVFVDHWDIFKYVFGAVAIGTLGIKIGLGLTGLATSLGVTGLLATLSTIAGYAGLAIVISVVVEESITLIKLLQDLRETKKLQDELNDKAKVHAKENVEALQKEVEELENMKKGTDEYNNKLKTIKSRLGESLLYIENGRKEYDDYIPAIKNIGTKLDEITNEGYTATINLAIETGEAEKKSNSFIGRLGSLLKGKWNSFITKVGSFINTNTQILGNFSPSKLLGKFGIFEKGLDYVPYDEMPAILHKGEAVVPAKYNPAIHSTGNEYTNNLLETLIMKIDDLSKRPNVFEIDGQQFANATYGLYEDANNRQGYIKEVVK